MTPLLSAVIAAASASRRQDPEVACGDQRATRANAKAAYCSRAEVVTTPSQRSAQFLCASRGWYAGGRFGGIAASTSRASSDGACCRWCGFDPNPAIHSHRPDHGRTARLTAGMAESGGDSRDSRTIQGASFAASPPISLSRASVIGGEWITLRPRRGAGPGSGDGSAEKWVCSRSRPAASWAAARARCQAAGCASRLLSGSCAGCGTGCSDLGGAAQRDPRIKHRTRSPAEPSPGAAGRTPQAAACHPRNGPGW